MALFARFRGAQLLSAMVVAIISAVAYLLRPTPWWPYFVWALAVTYVAGLIVLALPRRPAEYVRRRDRRQPILYLRSFIEDDMILEPDPGGPHGGWRLVSRQRLASRNFTATAVILSGAFVAWLVSPCLVFVLLLVLLAELPIAHWRGLRPLIVQAFEPLELFVELFERYVFRVWPTDLTMEECLARHFSRFGPFVATGNPNEGRAPRGAARSYLRDDQWQDWVLQTMREARITVLQLSDTRWTWWELESYTKTQDPTRLLLFTGAVAAYPSRYDYIRDKIRDSFRINLPREARFAFIYFDNDWTSYTLDLVSNRHYRPYSQGSAIDLEQTLLPFVSRVGEASKAGLARNANLML
jgi:hypothetical protein